MGYRLYKETDDLSTKRDAEILSLIENKNIDRLKALIKEGETLRLTPWEIMNVVSTFNSNFRDKKSNLKVLKSLRKYGLTKAKIKDDILRLKFLGTKSSAYPINKLFENADEFIDFDKRQGQCHVLSLRLARGMDEQCSVLTGFSHGLTDRNRYLHSVVRVQVGKYPRIIDTSMNTMMTEEFYKKITGFEVLTEVPSSQIKEDAKLFSKVGKVELKKYFLYRDKYIKELEIRLEKKNAKKIAEKKTEESKVVDLSKKDTSVAQKTVQVAEKAS